MENFEIARKCICAIEKFGGNTADLPNFVRRVESLSGIMDPLSLDMKRILLGYIEDRLVGRARDSVTRNGSVRTWLELKEILIREHGEKTPRNRILDEISLCRCTSGIENFYNSLNHLLVRLNNTFLLDEGLTATHAERNKGLVLEVFKQNLPEPVKGIIIGRNPTCMADAFAIIRENGYLRFNGLPFGRAQHCAGRTQGPNCKGNGRNGKRNYGPRPQSSNYLQEGWRSSGFRGGFGGGSGRLNPDQSGQNTFTERSRNFNARQGFQNNGHSQVEPMDISNNFQNFRKSGLRETCPI